ncbi:hypothetical protein N9W44_02615 [Alphaproteobacteria bacterium]|nr:hypothetical protein [Alphaproteobacteria bacterium]
MLKLIIKNVSKLKFFCYYLIECGFLIGTGNWKAFYGWYLDRQDRKKTAHQIIELGKKKQKRGFDKGLYDTSMGEYHLKFMRTHGLKSTDKVFELGFGFGRTAIPLIKYLKKGGYAGSEISKERLRIASEWIGLEKLTHKNPKLVFAMDILLLLLMVNRLILFGLNQFLHIYQRQSSKTF